MSELHSVVIIGGGFGGLYSGKALKRSSLRVALLDSAANFLLQLLSYQVAGFLPPAIRLDRIESLANL